MSKPARPIMLGVEDAAIVLDVTPQTIRKWAAAGRVEAKKTGRSWVVVLDPAAYAAAVASLAARRTADRVVTDRAQGRRPRVDVADSITADLLAELGIEPASALGSHVRHAADAIMDAALGPVPA